MLVHYVIYEIIIENETYGIYAKGIKSTRVIRLDNSEDKSRFLVKTLFFFI